MKRKASWAAVSLALLGLSVLGRTWALPILGAAGLVAYLWWRLKPKSHENVAPLPRMQVVTQRPAGPGCQLLLVDCDGQTFFIVQGPGFAEIRETAGEETHSVVRQPPAVPLFSPGTGKVLWS